MLIPITDKNLQVAFDPCRFQWPWKAGLWIRKDTSVKVAESGQHTGRRGLRSPSVRLPAPRSWIIIAHISSRTRGERSDCTADILRAG